MKSAIIFDFNGTLFWDFEEHYSAWNEMSQKYRGKDLTREEFSTQLFGKNNRATLEYLLKRTISDEEIEALSTEKEEKYLAICEKESLTSGLHLAPGAVELLRYLCDHHIPHAIATSAGEQNVLFYRKIFNLDNFFEVNHIIYDRDGLPSKPDPALYNLAINSLGVNPSDCIVFEDAKNGILSAKNAGIDTIFAIGPKDKHPLLEKIEGVTKALVDFNEFDRSIISI